MPGDGGVLPRARDSQGWSLAGRENGHCTAPGERNEMSDPTEEEFTCTACKRTFKCLPADLEEAFFGHLCIAMDRGLTQAEGLKEIALYVPPCDREDES
jgi:hypothetical protein